MQAQIWRKLKSLLWGRLTFPLPVGGPRPLARLDDGVAGGVRPAGYLNFYLNYGKYQRMVAQVKSQHLTPGQKVSERVDDR